jgi:hypothetical protein
LCAEIKARNLRNVTPSRRLFQKREAKKILAGKGSSDLLGNGGRMAVGWIPCGSGFIEADVIRWTEGIWRKPRRRRGRSVHMGERTVVAEVLRDDGE